MVRHVLRSRHLRTGRNLHWVADGNLTEIVLRELIYSYRRKHAAIQLADFFEKEITLVLPKLKLLFKGDLEVGTRTTHEGIHDGI